VRHRDANGIDRRGFLVTASGLVGAAVSGVGWALTKSCPPTASTSCTPSPAGSVFPLGRPAAAQRFLVTSSGAPFFLLGDTAWSLAVSASQSDVTQYLDNRKAKGFNAFSFNAIESTFAGGNGNRAPSNWYNQAPFTNANDFTTVREAYWTNVDFIVQQAAARNMLCLIFPSYEGYGQGNQGWYQQMASQGAAKLRSYGAWLANRYLVYDNILWVMGGDNDAVDKTLTKAIINGIRSVTTKWLFAWHGARNTQALVFWAGDLAWLDLNTIYDSQNNAAANAGAAYGNATIKPFSRIEDTYENPIAGSISPSFIRWLAWDSVLQGGTGAIYGDVALWRFNGPGVVADTTAWVTAMERPAGSSMKYLRQLCESKSWTNLVPDYATRTWMTTGWTGYNLATRANDASFGIGYLNNARQSVTFDLSKLTGPNVLVRWYDPTNGAFVVDGTYVATGSHSFARHTPNAEGSSDWALLFESK
jgi:hypothetical protein